MSNTFTDEEQWLEIEEFPRYMISSEGRVFNTVTNRHMSVSATNYGHPKISLLNETGRHTRSVGLLVAIAFVPPPNLLCDRIIYLDGDLLNFSATNLAWRPRWFAWKYSRQLSKPSPAYYRNLRVVNLNTGIRYNNIEQAGMSEGLLFEQIWHSTYTGDPIFPDGSIWAVEE